MRVAMKPRDWTVTPLLEDPSTSRFGNWRGWRIRDLLNHLFKGTLMLRLFRTLFVCLLFFSLVQVSFGSNAGGRIHSFPITFEGNRGQAPAGYRYVFHRDGVEALFSAGGVDFVLADTKHLRSRVHMSFVGGHAEPEARSALGAHANYFIGNDPSRWLRNVPLYPELDYESLYTGVSLSFYGNGEELEHDFTVDPEVDPSQIAFRFDAESSLSMAPNGDLWVRSGGSSLRVRKPVAYQLVDGVRQPVGAEMQLGNDGTVRFKLDHYDRSRSLVIDPVYVFSSYLGGTGADIATGVATDSAGNILVTGYTSSTDFPTSRPEQGALGGCDQYAGCQNAFITKFDPTGKTLIYSTYLGGSVQDRADAIAVDPTGNAIVAGVATSADFPHAGAIASPTCAITSECYFLASLSTDGSKLNYSGAVGGHANPGSTGLRDGDVVVLAADGAGNAYLAGVTSDPQFAVTPGTLASSFAGYPTSELFVLKTDPTGKLVYSTPVPGNASNNPATNNNSFGPTGMKVDASGNATIAGAASLGLPTTAGVVAAQFPNAYVNVSDPEAGFVLQLNSTASAINFASYLPGTAVAGALAVDSKGNMWIAGTTYEANLPVSSNAYQKVPPTSGLGGITSGYILELNTGATAVLGGTYLDGTGSGTYESSSFGGIALDSHSNVFVVGLTNALDFPLVNPFATEFEFLSFNDDMIVAEMSADLSTLEFSSFLNPADPSYGGSNYAGIAIDNADNLIVAGTTSTRDFPTTAGSFEPQLPPAASQFTTPNHTFVTKINLSTPAPSVCLDQLSIAFGNVNANQSGTRTLHVTNCGNAALNIQSVNSSDPTVVATQSCGSVAPGTTCPVTLTFTPISSNATSGTITLVDNAATVPQTLAFAGQGIAPRAVPQSNPFSLGHIVVGTEGPATALIISNLGQAPLVVNKVTLSGPGFSIAANGCGVVVANYGSCYLNLVFAPTTAGASSGSVVISSNDPVNPQLTVALTGVGDSTYGVPIISSIGAGTILIGSGPTTVYVTGSNFYPQSVAQLNGTALSTTFIDNNDLQATIPSAITSLGELHFSVMNPAPGGGFSNAATVTPYQTLPVNPAFLASVPATGLLYAAVSTYSTTNPNTVIPIDPKTATPGTPIAVGNNPVLLAPSSDGSYLYVANQVDQTVQRINLKTNAVERTFAYTPNIYCSTCSNIPATDLESVPGRPQEVLMSQGSWLTLYNDAGSVNYVPNDGICCRGDPDFGSIALAGNPLTIYGLPFTYGDDYFQVANLTSSGLQYTRTPSVNLGGNNTTGAQVVSDGTLLYTSAGQIWDPSTRSEVGTFPVTTFNSTSYPNTRNITLDSSLGAIYTVGDENINNTDEVVISSYDMKSHSLFASLQFPLLLAPIENNLVRWGTDGLAFIGPGATNSQIYLVRSSIVSPKSANPTPVLSTIAPATIGAGGSAFTLTVNGSGFLANSAVEWNGSPLATTYLSSQQLTATVPATAIAQPASAQVAVFNPAPGGGSSIAQVLVIVDAPAAVLSQSQLTFSNQAQGMASAAQTVTLTNSGTAALNISSISASGDFKATSACGGTVAVNASCTVSVTFTPTATGNRTGTLTVTDNAVNNPQTVSLTGTGVADVVIAAGQGGSTSATVASGTTATYNLSVSVASGFSGAVSLTCTGAPLYATCTVAPSSLNLASGGTGTFAVTVATSSTQTASVRQDATIALAGTGLLSLLSLLFLTRAGRRSTLRMTVLFAAAGLIGLGIISCGGGGGGGGGSKTVTNTTPPGTYTLTVTASGTGASVSQSLKLVVQ
jgi:Abnormal spindle-like microcephaly-assoc'd, ASPM-SPD-2-Hydin/Beta-propeller repeat/Protein of unknown function (DUF1573)